MHKRFFAFRHRIDRKGYVPKVPLDLIPGQLAPFWKGFLPSLGQYFRGQILFLRLCLQKRIDCGDFEKLSQQFRPDYKVLVV